MAVSKEERDLSPRILVFITRPEDEKKLESVFDAMQEVYKRQALQPGP